MRLWNRLSLFVVSRGFSSRFRLASLTRLPLIGRALDGWLFGGDDIVILPRDAAVTIDVNLDQPDIQDMVLPSDVLRTMIRKSSNIFLMNSCLCRTSNGCQDYPRDLGCIFLGPATKQIDHDLGRMVDVEEALRHVDRCQEAGLVHLIGRNKIDTVWMGVRPKEDLMTICHCCECCCLWKMIPYVASKISRKITGMPGVTLSVDAEACVGCGRCLDLCFVGAIALKEGKVIVDHALCRQCGRCAESCPSGALRLEYDPETVSMTLDRISPLVDVSRD